MTSMTPLDATSRHGRGFCGHMLGLGVPPARGIFLELLTSPMDLGSRVCVCPGARFV